MIHSKTTSSALQMGCTFHCHSYNLVFVHAYTPIPLRVLKIFVHKIVTLQCHSVHLNIFTLRNIHSNAISRTQFIPSVEHMNELADIQANIGFWNPIYSITRYIKEHWPKIIFEIWQQKIINTYIHIVQMIFIIWQLYIWQQAPSSLEYKMHFS